MTLPVMQGLLNVSIGKRVKTAREHAGLSQERLAEIVGKTKDTISNIERGRNMPTLETMQKICDGINVPIVYLFDDFSTDRVKIELKAKLDYAFRQLNEDDARAVVAMIEAFVSVRSPD
ncbi:helix-turn-helix domain-containing protein [Methylobacterium sp. E-025]|uniref:helix-turn-helix domain-containing protein n=1 Tax=Methylobacterium sp. E-025 TaxID=2836561 RepID=UPI001FB9C05A|nr:helix-turn-helix transcriptional regulator [Methylobacterium sp. E-025]MCJ2110209.1 helix-turn-helix domain-containing protein [Methylobacterium sp. E-025]